MKSLSLSTPHVIAMVGLPGAGKSHFAREFADNFSCPMVDEMELKSIAREPSDGTRMAAAQLAELMKTRRSVVFEGQLDRRVERESLIRYAKKHGYKTLFIWVQTDPKTARSRALKYISEDDYLYHAKIFSPPHDSEPYIVISGHHTHATQARTLLRHLTSARAERAQNSITIVPAREAIRRKSIG